jgi:hypothetical protein
VRRWKQENPGDKREPERVELIRRRFVFPPYYDDGLIEPMLERTREMQPADKPLRPQNYREPQIITIGHFDKDGNLRP